MGSYYYPDEAYAAAQMIVDYRNTLEYGIETYSELSDLGIDSELLSMMQSYASPNSNFYSIRCTATVPRGEFVGTKMTVEAVINRKPLLNLRKHIQTI